MSRCELTGKSPVVKNKVSHSNIKTKSIALPNVQKKRLYSKVLNQFVRLQISTSALRDVEHMGGFDVFIIRQNPEKLSKRATEARAMIVAKMKSKKKSATKATAKGSKV